MVDGIDQQDLDLVLFIEDPAFIKPLAKHCQSEPVSLRNYHCIYDSFKDKKI